MAMPNDAQTGNEKRENGSRCGAVLQLLLVRVFPVSKLRARWRALEAPKALL